VNSYPPWPDGWVRVVKRGFMEACCDCGLVHRVDYRIKDGHIEIKAERDEKATAAHRRSLAAKRKRDVRLLVSKINRDAERMQKERGVE
jgi:hypothetical protein